MKMIHAAVFAVMLVGLMVSMTRPVDAWNYAHYSVYWLSDFEHWLGEQWCGYFDCY